MVIFVFLIVFILAAIGSYKLYNSKWLNEFKIDTYNEKSVDNLKRDMQDAESKYEEATETAGELIKEKQKEIKQLKKLN